jgi:hypothetical protein
VAKFELKAYARQGAAARVADLTRSRIPNLSAVTAVKGERVKALYIPLPQ